MLVHWPLTANIHVAMPDARISAYVDNDLQLKAGFVIGYWDEAELAAERSRLGIAAKSG